MNSQEILKLEKCLVKDTKKKSIDISVYMVARGCFNDEMLVKDLTIKIEDISDKPLFWFDLYLGRKADNKIKMAVAYVEGYDVYLLENDGKTTTVVKANSILASEDYDESYLISTHIR